MSGGFNAKTVYPSGFSINTKSGEFQHPFFFGGSQVPVNLSLPQSGYSGSGISTGRFHHQTKEGKGISQSKGHNNKIPVKLPFT